MEDDSAVETVEYQHFRIPEVLIAPRKGRPPGRFLFPWIPYTGFVKEGYPFVTTRAKPRGGRAICTVTTESGEVFTGQVDCSCSQVFLTDYGEDTALNRARVAQGNGCSYCREVVRLMNETKNPDDTADRIKQDAHKCADEVLAYVEKTGRAGVGVAYFAISDTAKELVSTVDVEDIVIAEEMAARHDRGFLETINKGEK